MTTLGWGLCWVLTTLPVPQPCAYKRKFSPSSPIPVRITDSGSSGLLRSLLTWIILTVNWFLLYHRLLIKCTFMAIWTPLTDHLSPYIVTTSRKKRTSKGLLPICHFVGLTSCKGLSWCPFPLDWSSLSMFTERKYHSDLAIPTITNQLPVYDFLC